MSDHSEIAWTDATWNPVRGCTKVSTGCANCYAQTFAERWRGVPGHPYEQGFDLRLVPEALDLPLRWRRPRRVFVNSMSDLFHEAVPFEFVARVFAVMQLAQHHTFQVLTKRAGRMAEFFRWLKSDPGRASWLEAVLKAPQGGRESWSTAWPFRNVWLGVSVENQTAADERIPHLLATPAAVRFLSCEPLLGPVDLDLPRCETHDREFAGVHAGEEFCNECAADGWTGELSYGHWLDPLNGGIQWVIVGGESGPKARPMQLGWASSIVRQCKENHVAVFMKQLGQRPYERAEILGAKGWEETGIEGAMTKPRLAAQADGWTRVTEKGHEHLARYLRLQDRAGADPAEWPEDLRVQQMPEAR